MDGMRLLEDVGAFELIFLGEEVVNVEGALLAAGDYFPVLEEV